RSSAIDAANSRILVGDSDLESVIAVDLVTGERTLALSSGIGEGPKMIAPRSVSMNSSFTYAYVIDDGLNVSEKVFEIDLATGDRRSIGDINSAFNQDVSGISYNEETGTVYAA